METAIIIVCLAASLALIFEGGVILKARPLIAAFCAFFGASLLVIAIVSAKGAFGTLHDYTLDNRTFVVKARVVDDTGGKSVYILYDLTEKKNRLAEFTTYPPSGYRETATLEKGVLLSPIKK